MDFTLPVFIPQIIITVTATISSLLFLYIIHTSCFPLHVKTSFGGLVFGSGMLACGHLGYVITEFTRGRSILYGDGVVYWCQLVHGFGLSFHTISFFVLSLDRLLLVIFPSLLDSLNKFSRIIAFLIILYCIVHSTFFVMLIYFSSIGSYVTTTTLFINLLIIPISCIGYIWSRTKYRRTVAILRLNIRYELASIRELTRVIFPIAIFDAILSSIAFTSAYLMGHQIITVLNHNRIYRNTLSVQSLLTTWFFLLSHRHFNRHLLLFFICFTGKNNRPVRSFTADKSDPIEAMKSAWRMRTSN